MDTLFVDLCKDVVFIRGFLTGIFIVVVGFGTAALLIYLWQWLQVFILKVKEERKKDKEHIN